MRSVIVFRLIIQLASLCVSPINLVTVHLLLSLFYLYVGISVSPLSSKSHLVTLFSPALIIPITGDTSSANWDNIYCFSSIGILPVLVLMFSRLSNFSGIFVKYTNLLFSVSPNPNSRGDSIVHIILLSLEILSILPLPVFIHHCFRKSRTDPMSDS